MKLKKAFLIFLVLFLLGDIIYSFLQHYYATLDGDLPNIVLPAERYQPLMNDPIGLSVVFENKKYASPNRFFAHWTMSSYFRIFPNFLQNFVSPIDSIYLACAIVKTLTQILLITLLAFFISGKTKLTHWKFIVGVSLVVPLFQSSGYYQYMGVIDHATTYTLFYALPLGLLMLFFFPFYQKIFLGEKKEWGSLRFVSYLLLGFFLSLNGPLVPPLVLLICSILLLYFLIRYQKASGDKSTQKFLFFIKKQIGFNGIILLVTFSLFSIYSYYVGSFTVEGKDNAIPILERYARLPEGIFNMLTQKLGFPILILAIGINLYLVKRYGDESSSKKIFQILRWVSFFMLVYILLLPFGGYREYRPNIIRRDTFLPITLCIFYLYGFTSFCLMEQIKVNYKKWYFGFLILIGLNFTLVDIPDFENNSCERSALEQISQSEEDVIFLEQDCLIMSWIKVETPTFSETNGLLLHYWNVTDKPILYYQEK